MAEKRTGARAKVPVVGLGAGGHAQVVVDILQRVGTYEIVGLLTPEAGQWHKDVGGVPVLGGDDLLPSLQQRGVRNAFIGIGGTERSLLRRKVYRTVVGLGFDVVSAIHPSAVIADSAELGRGVTVMPLAAVGPFAWLDENVIANTGAVIEHDCRIEAHAHVAPRACLGGGVKVGAGTHVGMGAVVLQGLTVGRNCVIGAGAVVVRDVPDRCLVMGVPARTVKPSPLVDV